MSTLCAQCYTRYMPHQIPANFTVDFDTLEAMLQAAPANKLPQAIVDAPFRQKVEMALLGLGITVFLKARPDTNTLDRIALSNTEMAAGSTRYSMKKFEDIKIPLDHDENALVTTYKTGHWQLLSDWAPMFVPELTPDQARLNQASAGIGSSVIYPHAEGVMIFSYFQEPDNISAAHHGFMERYIKLFESYL